MIREADILLVEDNRTDAELIAEALKESGIPHRLDLATDGAEALEVLAGPEKPHLVLLDLNLPKKSGLDVLREIKQNAHLCAIPVVILTNSESAKDVVACYESFCSAYIRKPLHFEDWVATLNCMTHFFFEVVTLTVGSLPKRRGCCHLAEPLTRRPPPPSTGKRKKGRKK